MMKEVLRCPQPAGVQACSNMPVAPETTIDRTGSHDLRWEYMHHIPGRLRLRALTLRKNGNRADAIEQMVKAIEGVSAAAVNLTTGSLVIIYDPSDLAPKEILCVLRRHGLIALPMRRNLVGTAFNADMLSGKVGRAVLYLVLESMLERSMKAAFAALF
jgi:hypothetical protein